MENDVEILNDGDNVFEYKDEQNYKIEEHLNRDFEFLILLLLIDKFEKGENTIMLDTLLKTDFWKVNYIYDEINDTNDHWCIESMVLDTCVFLVEDLRLGRVDEISLSHYSNAIDQLAKNAVSGKFQTKDTVTHSSAEKIDELTMNYSGMIKAIAQMRLFYDKQKEQIYNNNSGSFVETKGRTERISFLIKEYNRSPLSDLVFSLPEFIEISFTLNTKKMKELKENVQRFLLDFAEDKYLTEIPNYLEKRFNFAKQIEGFSDYLKSLPLIGGSVNIPSTILTKGDFEAVKILEYLRENGLLHSIGRTTKGGLQK